MKFFRLINGEGVHPSEKTKVIPAENFSTLEEAKVLVDRANADAEALHEKTKKECVALKAKEKKRGFQEGLEQWNTQLALLQKETENVRQEMEEAIVPLALTAVKKIIGQEIELKPQTIVGIVGTALRTVSQHHKITIYASKSDLDTLEENREELKQLFEHLEMLKITSRGDVEPGGCIIETESGIINAQLDNQLKALEGALHAVLKNNMKQEG